MKIGFAQINPTVGDLRGNCELIIGAYERLAAAGAELILTPELAISGYPPQDLVFKSRFVSETHANLAAALSLSQCNAKEAACRSARIFGLNIICRDRYTISSRCAA